MKQKVVKLSRSVIAFLVLMSKVKNKTLLEVIREFNENSRQRKENTTNNKN